MNKTLYLFGNSVENIFRFYLGSQAESILAHLEPFLTVTSEEDCQLSKEDQVFPSFFCDSLCTVIYFFYVSLLLSRE